MNLPLEISKKYLFGGKLNLVNIISIISMLGVAGMTCALVVILSVFNGFDVVVSGLMNQVDPDLKIESIKGKSFLIDSLKKSEILKIEGLKYFVESIEETSLFQYEKHQNISVMKGVDSNYVFSNGVADATFVGEFVLEDELNNPYCVLGSDIASKLDVMINGFTYLKIYVPIRTDKITLIPEEAFRRSLALPSGIFHIHQDYDSKFVYVNINFARQLLGYAKNEVNSVEITCLPNYNPDKIATQIQNVIGEDFTIKNRYQQQDLLYKIMKSEKFSIFVMLSFILIIASFNIVGALTMLIIDKKNDIETLTHLGATTEFIRKIFINTGRLITIIGAFVGVFFGLVLCLLQQHFGLISFPEGSFIIDSYPVDIRFWDIILTIVIVISIGFVASVIPVKKTIK
ncbi:MAG: ABC transporter permease [Bacteroidales bacterium]|nr:ABC transporter permease [Bacteroidales bacterium]